MGRTRIVNLVPGSVFAYAGKRYVILKGMVGKETRFRIQEHCRTAERRYAKKSDQVYVFCFSTGQLGSFHNDTSVKHLPYFALPLDSKGVTQMTSPPDAPIPETAQRDALLEVVAKYEWLKHHREKVDEAKANRQAAQDEYDTACTIAEEICAKTGFSGTLVRGTKIIHVRAIGISVEDGEILE